MIEANAMTDEFAVALWPPGQRINLLMAAFIKRDLMDDELSDELRLKYLEFLDEMVDGVTMTGQRLAIVKPMSNTEFEMFTEAIRVSNGSKNMSAGFQLLERGDVFKKFCAINPSLLEAIKWRGSFAPQEQMPSRAEGRYA